MSPIELRQSMINNPHHRLWDKPLNKWTEKERQLFDNLDDLPIKNKKKGNWKAVNSVKVIRISNGKEYDSISECRRQNGFYKQEMDKKLKQGTEFKKI